MCFRKLKSYCLDQPERTNRYACLAILLLRLLHHWLNLRESRKCLQKWCNSVDWFHRQTSKIVVCLAKCNFYLLRLENFWKRGICRRKQCKKMDAKITTLTYFMLLLGLCFLFSIRGVSMSQVTLFLLFGDPYNFWLCGFVYAYAATDVVSKGFSRIMQTRQKCVNDLPREREKKKLL